MIVIGIDPSLSSTGISDGSHHELVKTAPGSAEADAIDDIDRRCLEITQGVADFINRHCRKEDEIAICVEAPMLSAHGMTHHLFEAGWLYHDLTTLLPTEIIPNIVQTIRVPSPTLRKLILGKGNIKKDDMKLAAFKKFGVEIAGDPGADQLFAFLLSRFGSAVLAGEIEFANSKRRGAGIKAKAAVRRSQRTKGAA